METFYDIVIHPKNNKCPLYNGQDNDEIDCNNCEHLYYIDTECGNWYVRCNYNESK